MTKPKQNVTVSLHSGIDIDGSVRKQVADFLLKLSDDPTQPGLHIEPVKNSIDKRIRTGRVNDFYRAVLFQMSNNDHIAFLVAGIYPHDDAYVKARSLRLSINPMNAVAELIEETQADSARTPKAQSQQLAEAAAQQALEQAEAEAAAAKAAAEASEAQCSEVDQETECKNKTATKASSTRETPAEPTPTIPASSASPTSPAGPKPAEVLREHGYDADTLYRRLGISPIATQLVMDLDDEAFLHLALSARPLWETEAFTGLLAGYSIKEVADELGITLRFADAAAAGAPTTSSEEADDQTLIDGLQHKANSGEFVTLNAPSLDDVNNVIDSLSFDRWWVFLPSTQKTLATRHHSGSARVSGGAGTGKTVVAVHRANNLLTGVVGTRKQQSLYDSAEGSGTSDIPRVLLTTFTRSLSTSLREMMNTLNKDYEEAGNAGEPGLYIKGIDQLVYEVLRSASAQQVREASRTVLGLELPASPMALDGPERDAFWDETLNYAPDSTPPSTLNRVFLNEEYEAVVIGNNITTLQEYRKVRRVGRRQSLNRSHRTALWSIMEAFNRKCAAANRVSFATMASMAAVIIEQRGTPLFDHIVVDEAQDFHAGHWRFLRACVAEGPNDIFLAEDSHQRIYGQRLVLSQFGIHTRGATRKLRINYRTTAENLSYAMRVLEGAEWHGSADENDPDNTAGHSSLRHGPAPILKQVANEAAEIHEAARLIKKWHQDAEEPKIGVLTRTRRAIDRISEGLQDEGVKANAQSPTMYGRRRPTASTDDSTEPTCSVMTMHSAKGLEFSHVIIIGVNDRTLPQRARLKGLGEPERDDVLLKERALLYVAASRARDQLAILYSQKPTSLLPLQG